MTPKQGKGVVNIAYEAASLGRHKEMVQGAARTTLSTWLA
jgi:hypothetical protein